MATVGTLAERWAVRKGGEGRWTAERFRRGNCQGCCSRQNSVSKDAPVLTPKHANTMSHGRRELGCRRKVAHQLTLSRELILAHLGGPTQS